MPNPILLDAMMPDTDGFEVGHILRNDPELTPISVVMVTAQGGQAERATGVLGSGATF